MKPTHISFTILLIVSILIKLPAQEVQKKTVDNPPYKETFYVLKTNPDIKHGNYKRTYDGFKEVGQYDNGKKIDIWEYYNSKGELEQKIDYTKGVLPFVKPFKSIVKSWIVDGEALKENNTGALPILIGGESRLFYYYVKYLRYPAEARRNGKQGDVLISAIITKDGRMIDEKVEEGIGFGLDEEALKVMQMIPDEWIPLKDNGENVDTKIILKVKFKLA